MKTRKWLLLLLALSLVLGASVSSTWAYFTDSNTVKGGYDIHLKPDTVITEEVTDHKYVTIKNKDDAKSSVFVRARAFTGSQYEQYLNYEGSANWQPGPQGFYYYLLPLAPGESTDVLKVLISKELLPEEGATLEEERNVIVVYESTPAVFKANGDPDFETAWDLGS